MKAGDGWLVVVALIVIAGVFGGSPVKGIAGPAPAPSIAPAPPPTPVPPPPSGVYTFAQLEGALLDVGLPNSAAYTGARIAEAESGGRALAVHLCPPNCVLGQGPERSYGPWQINLIAHPRVSIACAESLSCADVQVKAISSNGTNWTPWSTFTSGAYLRFG